MENIRHRNWVIAGVFFASMLQVSANPGAVVENGAHSTSDIISLQNKLDLLKGKMNDGQISPEPQGGPGATLAEQIQLVEGELIKQTNTTSSIPTNQHTPLPTQHLQAQLPQTQSLQTDQPQGNTWGTQHPLHVTSPPVDHPALVTTMEFETVRLHIQALEARIALLEKQIASLSQRPTIKPGSSGG